MGNVARESIARGYVYMSGEKNYIRQSPDYGRWVHRYPFAVVTLTCPVCFKTFFKRISNIKSRNVYCSQQCKGKCRSEKSIAAFNAFKNQKYEGKYKENHLKSMSNPEYLKKASKVRKGIPLPLNSRAGATENHFKAKTWWFIKNKKHYKFKNLSKFIRDNKHLFEEEDVKMYDARNCKAGYSLRRLLQIDKKTGNPIVPSHFWKGWTIGDKNIILEMDKNKP